MKALKIFLSLTLSSCLLFTACIDTDIDDAVEYDDFYKNLDDADAAILGLYGDFMKLAGQVVVLNELRGDLLDVTSNADQYLLEVNRHQASKNNKWTDPTPFYSVIANCNDMLYNFDLMKKNNRLTDDEYNERYSDVGALRCWLYYQLGVHFGKVPYITEPIVDYRDLSKYGDSVLDLDQLIPELIKFMRSLPTLENYVNSKLISGSIDGYSLVPYFIPKRIVLGDLLLFNNDYLEAATVYREVLAYGENFDPTSRDQYMKNRIGSMVWQSGDSDYFAVLFNRYKAYDFTTYYNAWKSMFSVSPTSTAGSQEMIWVISYDYQFAPTYPFVELFANSGKGAYMLKPSAYSIDKMWGGERQVNGYPYDSRGIGGGIEESAGGEYYVSKYLADYDAVDKPFQQQGKWFLYRAAVLNLRYAEAANRSNFPRLAWALMNDGLGTSYGSATAYEPNSSGSAFRWRNESGEVCRGDSTNYSSYGPGLPYPEPFYLDGRSNGVPYLRSPWRNNVGIRGRANMPVITMDNITTLQDSVAKIEKDLLKEAALEYGFEGHRWTDMIRIARRMEKQVAGSGTAYLNELLKGKYEMSGQTAPVFTSEDDWYLEFF